MRLFVSWSKLRSKKVAEALCEYLPYILDVTPWMSSLDLEPGELWAQALHEQLVQADVGIVCVTKENLKSEWLLFESGALAAKEGGKRLFFYILDDDAMPGVAIYQATRANRDETWQLVLKLDELSDALIRQSPREEVHQHRAVLQKRFDKFFPELEGKITVARLLRPVLRTRHNGIELRLYFNSFPGAEEIVVGREKDVDELFAAWKDPARRIVTYTGEAGQGKTALMQAWLDRLQKSGYAHAQCVFWWSFFDREQSTEVFLDHALRWFGDDDDPAKGSLVDRAARLAKRVREKRTLLVLEGLPKLIGDDLKAMRTLLDSLTGEHSGLCVVTGRDLTGITISSPHAKHHELGPITKTQAASLLKQLGVKGNRDKLRALVNQAQCHGLTLTLLAKLIKISGQKPDGGLQPSGTNLKAMLEDFDVHLAGHTGARDILRLIAMADGPLDLELIQRFRETPIAGLTDGLVTLPNDETLNQVLEFLENLQLIDSDPSWRRFCSHDLVRAFFAERVETLDEASRRDAHQQFFEYYTAQLYDADGDPIVAEDRVKLEPAFTAIKHGCLAGCFDEAFTKVYWNVVAGSHGSFRMRPVPASDGILASLEHFFSPPFRSVRRQDFARENQACVLSDAAHYLFHMGRLDEAVEPFDEARRLFEQLAQQAEVGKIRAAHYYRGARCARLAREIHIALGDLDRALTCAEESTTLAESGYRSAAGLDRYTVETELAGAAQVKHYIGQGNVEELFAAAMEKSTKAPPLRSFAGYWQCEALLDELAEFAEQVAWRLLREPGTPPELSNGESIPDRLERVLHHAERLYDDRFETVSRPAKRIDHGLALLTMARVKMYKAMFDGQSGQFPFPTHCLHAKDDATTAVRLLEEANQGHHLVRGLLVLSQLLRWMKMLDQAEERLNQAIQLCEERGMQLYLADCRLERAALMFTRYQEIQQADDLQDARKCLQQVRDFTGTPAQGDLASDIGIRYRRKDDEIALLATMMQVVAPAT